ncbi:hypothetical protein ScPMuIL_008042 [Solemya velum]
MLRPSLGRRMDTDRRPRPTSTVYSQEKGDHSYGHIEAAETSDGRKISSHCTLYAFSQVSSVKSDSRKDLSMSIWTCGCTRANPEVPRAAPSQSESSLPANTVTQNDKSLNNVASTAKHKMDLRSTDPKQFELYTVIGSGCEGAATIALAKYLPTGLPVAVKRIDLEHCDDNFSTIQKEIVLCRQLKHEKIMPYLGTLVYQREIWVVMPLMAYGSCTDLINAYFTCGLPEQAVAYILKNVLQALEYLHSKAIIHRSLIIPLCYAKQGILFSHTSVHAFIHASVRRDIVEAQISVDPKHHRHFVARRGEVLRHIAEEYGGVTVSFPRSGVKSDKVVLKGAKDCVEGAKKRIQDIVEDLDAQVVVECVIPQQYHRTVMGAKGSNVQEVTRDFGSPNRRGGEPLPNGDVEIPEDDGLPKKTDIILITGKPENCEKARLH